MTLSALSTRVLFAAISNHQLVEEISLRKMRITAAKMEQVAAIGGSVRVLDLSLNKLGDLGMTHLSNAFVPEEFDDDDYTCALSELYLNKCSIVADEGFQTLCTNVLGNTMSSTLKKVDFSNNSLGAKGSESLGLFLNLAQNLEVLRAENCLLDTGVVCEPLRTNSALHTSLKEVDISKNPFDDAAAENIGGLLKRSECIELIVFVKMDRILPAHYKVMLESLFGNKNKNLKPRVKLNFSENKFSHQDVTTFSSQIETSSCFPISQLTLDDCNLGIEGVSLIAQSIVERKPGTLKKFSVARNTSVGFFTSATSIHGFQTAVSRLIKGSEPLMELKLSGDVSHKLGTSIVSIVEALKSNKTIVKLDVSHHKSGDKLALMLGDVLKVNKTLAYIDFDKNNISIEGFKSFLEGMKGNKRVIHIGPPVRDFARASRGGKKEENGDIIAAIEAVVSRNAAETGRRGSLMSGISLEQIERFREAEKNEGGGKGKEDFEIMKDGEMEEAVKKASMDRKTRYSEAIAKSSINENGRGGGTTTTRTTMTMTMTMMRTRLYSPAPPPPPPPPRRNSLRLSQRRPVAKDSNN